MVHTGGHLPSGTDERWPVMLRPTRLEWVPVVLEWPRDNVEAELRRAIESLRSTVDKRLPLPTGTHDAVHSA